MLSHGKTGLFWIASLLIVSLGPANAECVCRANGQDYQQGQLACLKLPSGERLARCDRYLNNTSWTFVDRSCPIASISDRKAAGAMTTPQNGG